MNAPPSDTPFGPLNASPSRGDHIAARIEGIDFLVLAERALFWQEKGMLIIADLHLGKSDIFRRHGIPVPHEVQRQDLQRLHRILQKWKPQELVILGDFVHGRFLGEETVTYWQALRHANGQTRFTLTRGNHDVHLTSEALLLDAVHSELAFGQVVLSHEPLSPASRDFVLNIHGHIHPAWRVPALGRKLPCLAYAAPYLNLPAFSEFSGSGPLHAPPQKTWIFPGEGVSPIALY